MAELIDQRVELEDAGEVQRQCNDNARVHGPHGGAVVVELFPTQVRQRFPLAVYPRKEEVKGHLDKAKYPVDLPRLSGGVGFRLDQEPHVLAELSPAFAFGRPRELSVVEKSADPHIVHERWEEGHHGAHSQAPAKFPFARHVFGAKVLLPHSMRFLRMRRRVSIGLAVTVAMCCTIAIEGEAAILRRRWDDGRLGEDVRLGRGLGAVVIRNDGLARVLSATRRLDEAGIVRLATAHVRSVAASQM